MLLQLEAAMKLSQQIEDSSHDADIWGEMADTYADLGDFEKAAQVTSLLIQDSCMYHFSVHHGSLICPAYLI